MPEDPFGRRIRSRSAGHAGVPPRVGGGRGVRERRRRTVTAARARPRAAARADAARCRRAHPATAAAALQGRRPAGAPHGRGGRRMLAVLALALIGGALWLINATFQPFHGDPQRARSRSPSRPAPTPADRQAARGGRA